VEDAVDANGGNEQADDHEDEENEKEQVHVGLAM